MDYCPFLLPLLGEAALRPGDAVSSPAEEERRLSPLGDAIWPSLAQQVRHAYGHAFLAEAPRGQTVKVLRRIADAGQRLLLVRFGGQTALLLEHPGGTGLADQMAPEGAAILLARPRLFLALWRQDADGAASLEPPEGPASGTALSLTESLLAGMARQPGLSDWHLIPNRDSYASLVRVDGRLIEGAALGREEALTHIHAISSLAGMESGPPRAALEGRLRLAGHADAFNVRASLVPSHFGPALTIRFLAHSTTPSPALEALGMDTQTLESILTRFRRQEGLWLVAGPTGSGKSTTLHALLRLAVAHDEKVLSIEDPVERTIEGVQQMNVDSPPGLTYAMALKASLRQAPNTLMIGEIRDSETAAIALQAARAGHRVLSTLHARDTRGLLGRLEDLGQCPEDVRRLQPILLHQRLLPRVCPACRTRGPLPSAWEPPFRERGLEPPASVSEGSGCARCGGGGSHGRQALFALGSVSVPDGVAKSFLAAARGPLEQGRLGLAEILPFLTSSERQALATQARPRPGEHPHLRENGSGLPPHFRLTHLS